MEHEIEGMLEIDELELSASSPEPRLGAELAILEDPAAELSAGARDAGRMQPR